MENRRNLKIQPRYVRRKNIPNHYVPIIRLTGKWLSKAGFRELQHVTVTVLEQGKLIITFNPFPNEKNK